MTPVSYRPWPVVLLSGRLRMRPPGPDDADVHHTLHADPRLTAVAAVATRADPASSRAEFDGWLQHWAEHGFGYWVVEDRDTGATLGFCGLRVDGDALNLCYRLAHEAHGHGFGSETARAVLAWAAEWMPQRVVHGMIRYGNTASIRTAETAGLVATESPATFDADGLPPSGSRYGRWVLPSVEPIAPDGAGDPGLLDELFALVQSVRRHSGPQVDGVVGPARADVTVMLRRLLLAVAREELLLVVLRRHDGDLLGAGWWRPGGGSMTAHTARLEALMVAEPGRNHGRILLCGMHGVLRRERPSVELLSAEAAGDPGLESFLAAVGYVPAGRLVGFVAREDGGQGDLALFTRSL